MTDAHDNARDVRASTPAVEFLRRFGVDALVEKFHVLAKPHPRFPSLVMLKYSQINSDMAEPVVQDCRGLIVDTADDFRVVSFPFRKFFNHGEPNAGPLDWSTATVDEKLDGSLMTLYWHAGNWHVASSGTPDAGGGVEGQGTTFAELFWKVWRELNYALPTDTTRCYMFELMTPLNRVVVVHERNRMVLIGCRSIEPPYEEIAAADAAVAGWEVARSFPLTSVEAVVAAADELNPIAGEGFVVRDAAFRRLKVKSPQYVALAHLKEGTTARRLLDIVRSNEGAEFLVHFPEFAAKHTALREDFERMCGAVDALAEKYAGIASQKDFAAAVVGTPFAPALFALRAKRAPSARAFFATCTLPAAERFLAAFVGPRPDDDAPSTESGQTSVD